MADYRVVVFVLTQFVYSLLLTVGWVLIGIGFDWPWQAFLGGGIICGILPGMLHRFA